MFPRIGACWSISVRVCWSAILVSQLRLFSNRSQLRRMDLVEIISDKGVEALENVADVDTEFKLL